MGVPSSRGQPGARRPTSTRDRLTGEALVATYHPERLQRPPVTCSLPPHQNSDGPPCPYPPTFAIRHIPHRPGAERDLMPPTYAVATPLLARWEWGTAAALLLPPPLAPQLRMCLSMRNSQHRNHGAQLNYFFWRSFFVAFRSRQSQSSDEPCAPVPCWASGTCDII